ncbi:MAG: transcription antitermination factor NusB [Bacteroidota bacterium]
MLTRRYLRIKVLQELYAFSRNQESDLAKAEDKMLLNIRKIYDLYIYQLSYLLELRDFEEDRQEEAKSKYYPTEEDLNPNPKFINNPLLKQIENNNMFQNYRKKLKINWGDQRDTIRQSLKRIRESEPYQKYMNSSSESYEEARQFLIKIITTVLPDDELLIFFYEDKNVNWVNDFDASLVMLEKTFRYMRATDDEYKPLPGLFSEENTEDGKNLDEVFVKKLFLTVLQNIRELDKLIKERTEKWDFDRIAILDIIILRMAITEFMHFETIPVKVTINEYIELSKIFSTPKSSVFVNGLLDKLKKEFIQDHKIKKIGRGLIDE